MIQITKDINPRRLNEELQDAFPGVQEFWLVQVGEDLGVHVPPELDPVTVQAVLDAHDPTKQSRQDRLRGTIVELARSAEGVNLRDLTAAQVRALLAVLLFKAGAVDSATLTVNALEEWI